VRNTVSASFSTSASTDTVGEVIVFNPRLDRGESSLSGEGRQQQIRWGQDWTSIVLCQLRTMVSAWWRGTGPCAVTFFAGAALRRRSPWHRVACWWISGSARRDRGLYGRYGPTSGKRWR